MSPDMIFNAVTGSGGALVTLLLFGYLFYSGKIVRGSELTKLQDNYAELNAKYLTQLEERTKTAEALANSLQRERGRHE